MIRHFCDTKAKVGQRRDSFQHDSTESKQSLTDEEAMMHDTETETFQEVENVAHQETAEVAKQVKVHAASTSVNEFLMKSLTNSTKQVIESIDGDPAPARALFVPSSSSPCAQKKTKNGRINSNRLWTRSMSWQKTQR